MQAIHTSGLRQVIFRKNKLSDFFIKNLIQCTQFDKYIKVIDISHNSFTTNDLKMLLLQSLRENNSLVNIDMRFNPGTNSSILK